MRLLHISDLHVCVNDVHDRIKAVLAELKDKLPQLASSLEFGVASEVDLTNLEYAVEKIDPDVICITGDVTSFGDRPSFERAVKFVHALRKRPGEGARVVVVTPGNHDVLCGHLAALLKGEVGLPWMDGIPRFLGFSLLSTVSTSSTKLYLRSLLKELRGLVFSAEVAANSKDPLANFRWFVEEALATTNAEKLAMGVAPVWCVPYGSFSLDPLWVNIGEVRSDEFRKFRNKLENTAGYREMLIALLHHNPISAPEVVENSVTHAYNSMPGASTYLREMQNAGVDLVLYGHQHRHGCCKIDFMPSRPGHLFLVGADSATCGESAGFNLLEIEGRYLIKLFHYARDAAGRFNKSNYPEEGTPLICETSSVIDIPTMSAHNEIRRYRYRPEDHHEWQAMLSPGPEDLLLVGPRQRDLDDALETRDRRKNLVDILKKDRGSVIRVLVTDPGLFERLTSLSKEDREHLNKMWGSGFSWEDQASQARATLNSLMSLWKELDQELKPKLNVRLSHILMPIGARARDLNKLSGEILVRLLPVGLFDILERPTLRLERRHDSALFSFYSEYLTSLWEHGAVVDWKLLSVPAGSPDTTADPDAIGPAA